jgi:redox-sensing transcriptional repressor
MPVSDNKFRSVPKPTLERLPGYLNYLMACRKKELYNISATIMAEDLNLNHVQVRKDLALISSGGRPRTGYIVGDLIDDIRHFLGYNKVNEAVLAGAGQLGKTLLSYGGFANYGLEIVASFDTNPETIGREINGKPVFPLEKLKDLCGRLNIHLGIITVPTDHAQQVCDLMVDSGILAVWNFAPVHLTVPEHVILQNENMAASLAILSNRLNERLNPSQKR